MGRPGLRCSTFLFACDSSRPRAAFRPGSARVEGAGAGVPSHTSGLRVAAALGTRRPRHKTSGGPAPRPRGPKTAATRPQAGYFSSSGLSGRFAKSSWSGGAPVRRPTPAPPPSSAPPAAASRAPSARPPRHTQTYALSHTRTHTHTHTHTPPPARRRYQRAAACRT